MIAVCLALGLVMDTAWIRLGLLSTPALAVGRIRAAVDHVAVAGAGAGHQSLHERFQAPLAADRVLGGIGSPLSYFAGSRFGAVEWLAPAWQVVLATGLSWAVLLPAAVLAGQANRSRKAFPTITPKLRSERMKLIDLAERGLASRLDDSPRHSSPAASSACVRSSITILKRPVRVTQALIDELASSAIAIETDAANEQHYEVPAAFYRLALGPHLKYSSGYWPEGSNNLDEAEQRCWRQTCEHAELADGQRYSRAGLRLGVADFVDGQPVSG
jgi:hypothetical protein